MKEEKKEELFFESAMPDENSIMEEFAMMQEMLAQQMQEVAELEAAKQKQKDEESN